MTNMRMVKTTKRSPVNEAAALVARNCFKINPRMIDPKIEKLIGEYMKFVEVNNGHRSQTPNNPSSFKPRIFTSNGRHHNQKVLIEFLQRGPASKSKMLQNLSMGNNTAKDQIMSLLTAGVIKSSKVKDFGITFTQYELCEGTPEYHNMCLELMIED